MPIRNRSTATEQQCRFVLRLAGRNADGTPLSVTYGGDTTDYCGRPGREERRMSPRGPILVVRCAEHAGQ